MKINQQLKSSAILMLVAFIWGFAIVGQKVGTEFMGPFMFSSSRMLLGSLTMSIPIIIQWQRQKKALGDSYEKKSLGDWAKDNTLLIKAGCTCGLVLFTAANTQQIALIYLTASKTGLLTTLYIVIVPLLGLFLKKAMHWNTWLSVGIAVVGLYFLTMNEALRIEIGDTVLITSAFLWAIHILVIDHYAPKVDVVKMSVIQFVIVMLIGFILSPFIDHHFSDPLTWGKLIDVMPALLWAGVMSAGVAYTLQAIGQKHANPTVAAVILSFEAVFSLVGGFIILDERLTMREGLGCALMFAAVILAELPVKEKESQKS